MTETLALMQSSISGSSQDNTTPIIIGLGQNFFMTIPYFSTLGTPYFDNRNVTDFLNYFSNLCTDYKLLDKEKMRRLFRYCDMRKKDT